MGRAGIIPADLAGIRLDKALAALWPDLSRSRVQGLMRDGCVRIGGEVMTDPAAPAVEGATADLDEPAARPAAPAAQPIPLAVLYEDDDLIVIDKPAGLVVHPAPGHADGTLVNALLAHCGGSLSGIGGVARPGIVHRLDKDTSGVLVVAKNDLAHAGLGAQFADHGRTGPLERAYTAVCWGEPVPASGTVSAPLARSTRDREKIAVVGEGRGRTAVTRYATREVYGPDGIAALLECRLETGRTHQIRVHLAHLRHPLIGDETYGAGFRTKAARLGAGAQAAIAALGRQALHAALLRFAHPRTGEAMSFESPLPDDLRRLREALREEAERAGPRDQSAAGPGAAAPR